jgi:hypothetical protein
MLTLPLIVRVVPTLTLLPTQTNHISQGLGSALHVATIHLATAMQHDRIFLWAPNTKRTPIPEDRNWWRPFVQADAQWLNDNVRSCCSGKLLVCARYMLTLWYVKSLVPQNRTG